MQREPIDDTDGHIERTEAPPADTGTAEAETYGPDDAERGDTVYTVDPDTGVVEGPMYYLEESDVDSLDVVLFWPDDGSVVETKWSDLRPPHENDAVLPPLDEESLPEGLRVEDDADEDERPPNDLLVMECVDAPVTLRKVEHTGRKDEWSDQMITGIVCRMHFESDSPQLLPTELRDAAEELARIAADGDPEKSNTFKVSIGRDIRSDFYTILDPKNRNHRFDVDDVKSPRLSISNTGMKLKWKVEAVLAPRVAAEVSENIGRDGMELTIEAIQPELFSGGGNPNLKR